MILLKIIIYKKNSVIKQKLLKVMLLKMQWRSSWVKLIYQMILVAIKKNRSKSKSYNKKVNISSFSIFNKNNN